MIKKLMETRSRLLREVTALSYGELNRKPKKNAWSIGQVCHHLYLTERAFTEAIIYGLKKNTIHSNEVEPKPIHLLNDRSKKADAPEMVIPSETAFVIQQVIFMLEESRGKLLDVLNRIEDESSLKEKAVKHPVFGYLPLYQWIETEYLHEQRHIEQIKEIKSFILQ
ncbi:DinB family protein [Neobacillus mesonae]|uniref:DinB family protein n=1 Tax=Neobacillus mesonae TaxID=1193713 RepID=UPI0037C52E4E